MSEILHQPGGFETYPEVEVPEISDSEINKIEGVEYFEEDGYVPDKELSGIMRMACSEIGKISNNRGKLSYEKIKEAEDKFLGRINNPNSNEELLAKVFFGIALAKIRATEREKGVNHKERNKFLKEDIEWQHWIGNFVYENQNNPEIIEEFWRKYNATFNELPRLDKDISKISKVGILGEVATMNLFDEISKEKGIKIKVEQASTEQDMNGIDLIVRFKNKSGESKIVIVQVKCVTKDRSNDENTVKFYSRFGLRDKNNLKNDETKKLKKACFDYEKKQRNSGNENISVSGGLWIEFTKVRDLKMIDNRGNIINEELKKRIKEQLKLQLELN